ncbi:MAG: SRPBCC family protein, partial [Rhodothermales bacterium]|nr:SRPBCC family protein [Rhodothermales bacterium]
MPAHDYHFVTRWRVEGAVEDVSSVLEDAEALVRWWPSVYLGVEVLEPGDADGVGKVVRLHTRGRLPYTLRWKFRVTESRKPHGWTLVAWGDFIGRGVWTFTQDGPGVDVLYDWRVRADKPLLRRLSFLLKPLFAYNH